MIAAGVATAFGAELASAAVLTWRWPGALASAGDATGRSARAATTPGGSQGWAIWPVLPAVTARHQSIISAGGGRSGALFARHRSTMPRSGAGQPDRSAG